MHYSHLLYAAIHPPVQGGNTLKSYEIQGQIDTPSRTGRKHRRKTLLVPVARYTLPYREETNAVSSVSPSAAIHPPVQGGNTQCLCGFQPPQTPRCAICTNGILSLLICHFSGILADYYKKTFSHNNFKVS